MAGSSRLHNGCVTGFIKERCWVQPACEPLTRPGTNATHFEALRSQISNVCMLNQAYSIQNEYWSGFYSKSYSLRLIYQSNFHFHDPYSMRYVDHRSPPLQPVLHSNGAKLHCTLWASSTIPSMVKI